ncbi:MAG TPA: TetR/AcrR family transcriptional regulator [Spirochaetia bacterium]|nr:TetR/AcrR family transcriptional regulator [Spirochaetia bacterium]
MATVKEWKERRGDEMRELILDSAAKIFNEKGFERATTKEVARRTGVSEGTIYNYFENKRELLLSLVRRFADTASSLFQGQIGSDIGDAAAPQGLGARYFFERVQMFREGLSPTLIFYLAKRDPEVQSILESFWSGALGERLRPQIKELQAKGVLREIDLDFLGAFFRAIVLGLATMIDIDAPETRVKLSLEEMSRMARDVVWYGLMAPSRREK